VAQKPDGKAAKTERVAFTRPAAERIAKVVRKVEAGDRGAAPLRYDRAGVGGGGGAKIRLCKTSSSSVFLKNTSQTLSWYTAGPNVEPRYSSTASGTITVYNIYGDINANKWISVAKHDGNHWIVIATECC